MILATLLCAPLFAADVTIEWKAPKALMGGEAFIVDVEVSAPAEGATVPSWLFTPAAFDLNGEPVLDRNDKGTVDLPAGAKMSLSFDLGKYIKPTKGFRLQFAKQFLDEAPVSVVVYAAAGKDLDFMEMPVADLSEYGVVLETNQGSIQLEFWPDVAPNHVRNFLDLAYTGFYDGVSFHRVIPGFMIQGGDPTGVGSGSGPRTLKAEFNDKKHYRGVLSQARGPSPDSGSCQFFIVHGEHATHLDNQYTGFGRAISGLDAVDAIATTPRDRRDKPKSPQIITKAVVVRATPE